MFNILEYVTSAAICALLVCLFLLIRNRELQNKIALLFTLRHAKKNQRGYKILQKWHRVSDLNAKFTF